MPEWQVRLQGNKFELELLGEVFTSPDLRVVHDAGEYFLTTDEFDLLNDATGILDRAMQKVRLANGAAKLQHRDFQAVEVHIVTRLEDHGGRSQWVHPRAIVLELDTLGVTAAVAAKAASVHAAVGSALRFLGTGPDNWVSLYNVYDVIREDVGGDAALKARGWSSRNEVRRFTQTANSLDAAGEGARHGKRAIRSPKHPMSLEEARTLIRLLLKRWIDAKGKG